MGIEHRLVNDNDESCRCPVCFHLSTVKLGEPSQHVGIEFNEPGGYYFACQNPKCNVERIYGDNCIMVSGK